MHEQVTASSASGLNQIILLKGFSGVHRNRKKKSAAASGSGAAAGLQDRPGDAPFAQAPYILGDDGSVAAYVFDIPTQKRFITETRAVILSTAAFKQFTIPTPETNSSPR